MRPGAVEVKVRVQGVSFRVALALERCAVLQCPDAISDGGCVLVQDSS